ncbi:MAG: hypothetical protein KJ737_13420 [Proteobacteria bacterium]|nr:hypothetical protein [Pseudomonadota bacterium]
MLKIIDANINTTGLDAVADDFVLAVDHAPTIVIGSEEPSLIDGAFSVSDF